jgi:hypothetical protein
VTRSRRAGVRLAGVLLGLGTLLAPGLAVAEDVSFTAQVNATKVGVDDQLQLTVTLQGRTIDLEGDLSSPSLEDLQVVAGPSLSTQVSFINGAMSQARSWVFVLQPTAVGRAAIGAFHAAVNGRERTTEPIHVEVAAGSILPRTQRGASPFEDFFGEDPFDQMLGRRPQRPAKVFVEAAPSRTTLYVGEPLLLSYWLYTQAPVSGLDVANAPTFAGFWSEDLKKGASGRTDEGVVRDGEQFRRVLILRRLLFPTRAGSLTVPPTTFRIAVPRAAGFFANMGPPAVISRATEPVQVQVKPIPDGAGLSGAVGRFSAVTTLDHDAIALGDAATVRFTVEGRGNLKWVDKAPPLAITGAKVFPPQAKEALEVTPAGMSGSKTWEYVVVPQTSGTLTVPPLTFRYFDPGSARVVAAVTRALPLTVAASAVAAAAVPPPGAAPSGGRAALATGVTSLPLRADLEHGGATLPAVGTTLLLATLGLTLLLHVSLVAGPRVLHRPLPTRAARPGRSPRQVVANLRRAGGGGMSKEAAAALIEGALLDLYGEADGPGEPSGERERQARDLLREARFIRYAPQLGDYSEKLQDVARRAIELVRRRS